MDDLHQLYADIMTYGPFEKEAWHSRIVSPTTALGCLLAHWRTALPLVVLGSLAGDVDDSTLNRALMDATDLFFAAATNPRAGGCVRPLTIDEIGHMAPSELLEEFTDGFPLMMADTLPLWTTGCSVNLDLQHALFDATQHINFTWVKFLPVVTITGYIMGVYGPFQPGRKANDGLILTRGWVTDPALRAFMRNYKGKILADFGFRGLYTFPWHEVSDHVIDQLARRW